MPLLVLGFCLKLVLLVCGKEAPVPEWGPLLCCWQGSSLQLSSSSQPGFGNQLFAWCFGVKTLKAWSTGLLGRAQGAQAGARVPGETLACSIPRATSRRSHLGQALAEGCPVTLNHEGLVQVRWFLGGFAGEAWAMASGTVADRSGIALNSQSVAVRV